MRIVARSLPLVVLLGCGGTTTASPHDAGGQEEVASSDSGAQDDATRSNDGTSPADTGAKTEGGQPDSGADSAASWSPVCPENVPTVGAACPQTVEGVYCEYNEAWWDVGCSTIFSCQQGTWADTGWGGSSSLPAPGPNPASCPSNPSFIQGGSACDGGITCLYNQGVTCECVVLSNDAGDVWECLPQSGCPGSRPRLGSACIGSMVCTYVLCAYVQDCVNGVWQPHVADPCQ